MIFHWYHGFYSLFVTYISVSGQSLRERLLNYSGQIQIRTGITLAKDPLVAASDPEYSLFTGGKTNISRIIVIYAKD